MWFRLTKFTEGRGWNIDGLGAVYIHPTNTNTFIVHDSDWLCIRDDRKTTIEATELKDELIRRYKAKLPIDDIEVEVADQYQTTRTREVIAYKMAGGSSLPEATKWTEEEKEALADFGMF
jgi:hypothetical protein